MITVFFNQIIQIMKIHQVMSVLLRKTLNVKNQQYNKIKKNHNMNQIVQLDLTQMMKIMYHNKEKLKKQKKRNKKW